VNTVTGVLLAVALLVSALDWCAVATRRRTLEYVCKPAAALTFLAAAVVVDPASDATRPWFCVALVACAVGDVFLMLPRDEFIAGLAAFAVAQACFAIGFAQESVDSARLVVGVAVVAAIAMPLALRFVQALRASGSNRLVPPVVAYVAVIGAMVACAIGTGRAWGMVGAALFLVSDALIGETRFVAPRVWGPVAVIVTYHLALSGLVVSLA
jgi:uncharacterized membrane protein YhhN